MRVPCILRSAVTLGVSLLISSAVALQLNIDDEASIRAAARTVAYGLQSYYKNNASETLAHDVGTFPYPPYYWWESGAIWGGMTDYWAYTNDGTWINVTRQALMAQFGPNNDLMNPNWFFSTGNDDQGFWALALMSALETGLPDPPPDQPSWLSVAEAAFNTQVSRWDQAGCNGGLRWQIFPENAGYNYMNTISNGAFFQLAARLARYTGNQTYVVWAEKAYDWTTRVGLIDSICNVWDGTDPRKGCIDQNHLQWSYNAAIFIHGAATLYNFTNGSTTWQTRLECLLKRSTVFFSPAENATDVMWEAACEAASSCDTDQQSFKAYLSRWLGKTSILAPFASPAISKLLRASAQAAARSCSGGTDGVTCGTAWWWEELWDGTYGAGQQLAALETIQSLLVSGAKAPLTLPNVTIAGEPAKQPTETLTQLPPRPTQTVEQFATAKPNVGNKEAGGLEIGWMSMTVVVGCVIVGLIV